MLKRLLGTFALIAVFGTALIESVRVSVAWWRGEIVEMTVWHWLGGVALPILLGLWWRYVSIFGKPEPRCLMPDDERRD